MKRNRMIYLFVLAVSAVSLVSCGKRRQKEGGEGDAPLLAGHIDGYCLVWENGETKIQEREGWSELIVDVEAQFQEIKGITVYFAGEQNRQVFFLDGEGRFLGREEAGKGEHTFELAEDTAYVLFPVSESEESSLQPKGLLVPGGQKEAVEGPYAGKYVSLVGDSLSAYPYYIPSGYGYHMDYSPEAGVGVADMWWHQLAARLGMRICEVNACAGSGVTDLGMQPERAASAGRGKELDRLGQNPDVILLWIGGNDVLKNVPLKEIREGYGQMLRDVTEAYPEAEIFCFTYYIQSEGDGMSLFNQQVRQLAKEWGLKVVDMENCGIVMGEKEAYLLDGVHPNKKGFQLIGAWAAQKMLEYN